MHYYYQKPGYLRLEFIQPHPGMVITYNPYDQQAHVWPSGFYRFPSFHMSPGNSMLRSQSGHRVDQSDVGHFWQYVQRVQEHVSAVSLGNAVLNGQKVPYIRVEGAPGIAVEKYHAFDIWLEPRHSFPLRATGYDLEGHAIDTVELRDLQFNARYPPGFFD